MQELQLRRSSSEEAADTYSITKRRNPIWKRVMDVVTATMVLLVLAPLFLVISVLIKSVSPGSVFFCQSRIGHGGKLFRIWKFRTMHTENRTDHRDYVRNLERSSPAAKPTYQSRLIPFGATLRSSSIDELPNLWNVLRGEMSLVGPRPDVLELEDYENADLRRFEVLPGITGLWQVSGKNNLSYDEMIELDIKYVDELSPWLDAKILLRTLQVLVTQDNN